MSGFSRSARIVAAALLTGTVFFAMAGCRTPKVADMYGEGRFHDITQIRVGASFADVERIMGSNYKVVWEEGLQGIDGGNTVWDYPEGRVYFGTNGVFKVVPRKYK